MSSVELEAFYSHTAKYDCVHNLSKDSKVAPVIQTHSINKTVLF